MRQPFCDFCGMPSAWSKKICVIRVICVSFIICGRKKIINVAITILTAIATTITTASCVGIADWGASLKILGRQVAENL